MACASSLGCSYILPYQKGHSSRLCVVNHSVLQKRTNTLYDCSLLAVQRAAKLLHVGGGSQNSTRPNIMETIWGVFVRKSLPVYGMSSKNSCPIRMFCKAVGKKTFWKERSELFFSNLIAVAVWWEMSKMPKPWAKPEDIKTSTRPLNSSILFPTAFCILLKSASTSCYVRCSSPRSLPSIRKHVKKSWYLLVALQSKMSQSARPWILLYSPFQPSKTNLGTTYTSARLLKAYNRRWYEPQHTANISIRRPGLETHHQTSHRSKLGVWLLYKTFRLRRLFPFFIVLHSTHYSLSSKKNPPFQRCTCWPSLAISKYTIGTVWLDTQKHHSMTS